MSKIVIKAEVDLNNSEMNTAELALEEVISILVARCAVAPENNYQQSIMDINGNTVGNLTIRVSLDRPDGCPICHSKNLKIERRPNGRRECLDCGWVSNGTPL